MQLWDFEIIIIYTFLEFIDKKSKVMAQMMMCTPCILRKLQVFKIIIIYAIFIKFIDNKKLEEDNGADDDVYIMQV
jgi:hypothetical protein